MRLAQVNGLSGPAAVVAIHSSDSIDALEAFFADRNIEARAISAPAWVKVGTLYDGQAFVEPEPEPEPEPQPAPQPLSVEEIRAELDGLREKTTAKYVAKWGDLSKRELWPLLDAEMIRAANETAETLNPEQYPAIVGFLVADEKPTVGPAVYAAAASLRQYKTAHTAHLRRSELLRERLLADYATTSDSQKLAWKAATAWAEGVAAWD